MARILQRGGAGAVEDINSATSYSGELRAASRLGVPLALGELGWMSTYIVDAMMIGRLPHSALMIGASSLGNTIFYAIVFFMIYLLNGMETYISQAAGGGNRCHSGNAERFVAAAVSRYPARSRRQHT